MYQRFVTACVLLLLTLLALFAAPAWLWMVLVSTVLVMAAIEYGLLLQLSRRSARFYAVYTLALALIWYAWTYAQPGTLFAVVLLLFWLGFVPLCLYGQWRLGASAGLLVGWLILLPFWGALLAFRSETSSVWHLLGVMAVAWVADVCAYLAGRAWGRHPLAPTISPNKTQEGAVVGMLAVLVYALIAQPFLVTTRFEAVLMALLLALASIYGDLFESWLKRVARVKDSGTLLPGHGGVLDRLDASIAVLGVYYAMMVLMAQVA